MHVLYLKGLAPGKECMGHDYQELFERNYGIFTAQEQERLQKAHVLIIGCGGIGGVVALILARCGLGRFTLVDFDTYGPTNMNRQIACFTSTQGRNKAEVIGEQILEVNPQAELQIHPTSLALKRVEELIVQADVVFPAADDMAFSLLVFRACQRLGKVALMVVPSGTWANVSIIMPDSPPAEDINGVPYLATYEELREVFELRRYKFGTYFYVPLAAWRIDYYRRFVEEGLAPAQICPTVWLASALGAQEIVKVISGKWRPVASPRYWYLTHRTVHINRIGGPSLQTLLVWQRRLFWYLFQTPLAPAIEFFQRLWWALFQRLEGTREHKRARSQSGACPGYQLTDTHPPDQTAAPFETHVGRGHQPGEIEAMPPSDPVYDRFFERNYGIFTPQEQARIRATRILVIGDSGTGETTAVILARCGFEHFTLVGNGTYAPADMNRQLLCFTHSLGESKTEKVRKSILDINPSADISVHTDYPDELTLESLVKDADIVIPAVEDLAYSVLIFRAARRCGRPAVLCMPSGSLAWVCVFTHATPTIEDVFGIPPLGYRGLRRVMHTREYRCAQYNFITAGDWRVGWYWKYFLDKRPLALICPVEWMAASLAAQETLKLASGRWAPVAAPRCWYIRRGRPRLTRFSRFIRIHRKLGWLIFGRGVGPVLHKLTHLFWRNFFALLKIHQDRRDKGSRR